jgi:hypothetical protein
MAQSTPSMRQADSLAGSIANDVADKASEYAGKAGQQIDRAMDSASRTARDVADQTREAHGDACRCRRSRLRRRRAVEIVSATHYEPLTRGT